MKEGATGGGQEVDQEVEGGDQEVEVGGGAEAGAGVKARAGEEDRAGAEAEAKVEAETEDPEIKAEMEGPGTRAEKEVDREARTDHAPIRDTDRCRPTFSI